MVIPTAAYYDIVAAVGGTFHTSIMKTDREKVERFLSGLPRGAHVLDVGCGAGQVAAIATEVGSELSIFGIDISFGMVKELARKRLPRTRVCVGDMECLPIQDAAFSAAICAFVFIHLDARAGIRALYELARVVKRGGRVFLATHTMEEGDRTFLHTHRLPQLQGCAAPTTTFYFWNKSVLFEGVAAAGFEITDSSTENHYPGDGMKQSYLTLFRR